MYLCIYMHVYYFLIYSFLRPYSYIYIYIYMYIQLDVIHIHSIVTAQRDASPLAFLVTCIAILTEQCQQQQPSMCHTSSSNSSTHTQEEQNKVIICSNCESEIAIFKCLQPGCPCNQGYCGLCDRVFHKAVAKRSHIRIPLPATSISIKRSLNILLHNESTGDGAIDIIQPIKGSIYINTQQQQQPQPQPQIHRKTQFFACPLIALLLASIRGMIDDRRIRMLDIPGSMLSPIISSYMKFYTEFMECGGK